MSEPRRALWEMPPEHPLGHIPRLPAGGKPARAKASPRLQAVLIAEGAVILFLIFVVVGSQLGAWR